MAPWGWPFGSAGPDLPESIPGTRRGGPDTAFEVFIDGALTKIHNEASGRSKEHRAVREECKKVLDRLRGEDGKETQPIRTPLDAEATAAVLEPLRLACATGSPKLVEPALGCLHKLVAHAYLQAESSPAGRLDDGTAVAQVVQLVSRCGEAGGEAVQLAVLRALLTIATADHFVVHGDSLMQSVRTAFNVAIGAESAQIQQTARNALLQMLNTIVKRVTQFPLSRLQSMASAGSSALDRGAVLAGVGEGLQATIPEDPAEGADEPPDGSDPASLGIAPDASQEAAALEVAPPAGDALPPQHEGEQVPEDSALAGGPPAAGSSGAAEAPPEAAQGGGSAAGPAEGGGAGEPGLGDTRTAELATLAERADLRGLEKAMDQMQAERGQAAEAAALSDGGGGVAAGAAQGAGEAGEAAVDVRRSMMREKRAAAWRGLSLGERDVLTVLSAVCKMAARDTGIGAVETLLHHGKLLSLELLVRVLENRLHNWGHVRAEFCEQLRQYLWPALLRNSLSPYREAFAAVARLLAAVLGAPRLRAGLKAEIGAFFPLILLRPLEADRVEAWQQLAALEAVRSICRDPQLLADVFVNYDCDLQASNLFERTLKGLARVAGGPGVAASEAARAAAAEALLLLVAALDERAQPIREQAEAAAAAEAADEQPPPPLPGRASEVARFGALKERKHSLEAGIALFNRNPAKGIAQLAAAGVLPPEPTAIASFMREHADALDATRIGAYFGDHAEAAVAAMHAYIDQERFAGLTIDAALRQLLRGFRLPGEAQQIDRIMEKFAERFCRDNEGAFHSADGAYLLAFALIMLNTDAHNPRADKKLACGDFVTMCQAQDESGAFAPILPPAELEAMYGRILERELPLPASAAAPEAAAAEGAPPRAGPPASRLAAALGLSHLFRSADWDKQRGVDVERKRLMAATQQLVARGGQHAWHSATHAEHVRPMLQVGGEHVRKGLSAALEGAADGEAAAPLLGGLTTAIRLAGLLDLDQVVEGLVASLAAAASVTAPAPPGSPAEARQLAALAALLAVAAGPAAGCLGSGWVTVLRTLSSLEQLKERALEGGLSGAGQEQPPAPAGAAAAGRPAQPPARSRSFGGGLLSRLGLRGEPAAGPPGEEEAAAPVVLRTDGSADGGAEEVTLRGAGGAMVLWAEVEGREAIERVFAGSAQLDGDAVVVFTRALCAVTQEELVPDDGAPARTYLLGRLMEAAFHNLARIRLIWARLWAALAPQLVAAACHADPAVAVLAVEHTRRLVTKLLARAELANFTYQEDALRPLAAVLRHSDSTDARERVVALIGHVVTAHASSLGSGWRSLLAALRVAAADGCEAVVDGALDALQALTPALWRGVGLDAEALPDVCAAFEAAMRNPAHARLSAAAAAALPAVAARLAAAEQEGALAARQTPGAAGSPPPPADAPLEQAWGQVATVLALVARHDPRPAVADAAAAALADSLAEHHGSWQAAQWGAFWAAGPAYALALPQQAAAPTQPPPVGWSAEGLRRVQRHAGALLPPLCACLAASFPAGAAVFEQVLALLVGYVLQPKGSIAALGAQLLQDALIALAPALDSAAWRPALRQLSAASAPDLASPIIRGAAGAPEPVGAALGEAIRPEAAARCHCRSAVLMQRACGHLLSARAGELPPDVQLAVLDVLQDSVQRAAAFGASQQRRAAATRLLAPAAAQLLAPPRPQNGHAHAGEADSLSDDEAEAAEAAAPPETPDSLAALARQEAEGGLLLLSLLVQRLPSGSQKLAGSGAEEAERRLLSVSRRLLSAAAASPEQAGDAQPVSEAADWTRAVRAPLVEAVLRGFQALEPTAWERELPALWPHLVRLIQCGQPGIRAALAGLLDAQLAPALRGLAA